MNQFDFSRSVSNTSSPPEVVSTSGLTRFADLGLVESLVRAARDQGYQAPTPIQQQAIPHVLAGSDVLGCAQTGTGKTAAFALPILQRLTQAGPIEGRGRPVRVLVLSPTRELALQIGQSFTTYGRHTSFRNAVIVGGVSQYAQVQALKNGADIVVATPGRLCDLLAQRLVSLSRVEVFVLDEADRMLDMGFLPDLRRVIAQLPPRRQTLFFSATMPAEIVGLANSILRSPVRVEVSRVASVTEKIEQSVYHVDRGNKRALLAHVLRDPSITRALVFTRTKHAANRLTEQLSAGSVRAEVIHGNKSQNTRERALARFKAGQVRVLVATDIASRGIDVNGISHVINFDLPNEPESYVHRIGRTGRAGAPGVALSFCSPDERRCLGDIERLTRMRVPVIEEHPFRAISEPSAPSPSTSRAASSGGRSSRPQGGRHRGRRPG